MQPDIMKELTAVGLTCTQVINAVPIVDGDQTLVGLVVAAHDKVQGDPELPALRDYLGGAEDPRWIEYVRVRTEAVEDAQDNEMARILRRAFVIACKNSVVQGEYRILRIPLTDWTNLVAAFQAAEANNPGV